MQKNDLFRKKILKIYAIALACGIPYLIFVLATGLRIPCVFYELTGLLCPGCGLTRMCVSMAKLDFRAAFGYNRAMFILFFVWNAAALFAFIGKPKFLRSNAFLCILLTATLVFLSIFAIIRNIY